MAESALNLVFFGTAEFAVPSLEALIEAGHNVLAVVTQPDKPSGRGRTLASSPVKIAAQFHGLTVLQPRRVRSEPFVERIRGLAPDLLAVAAFGQIMPQSLLDVPPLGPINVHGSLLPRFRGAAPIQRALMAGETITGVTTMWMDSTLDTGDILLASSLPVDPGDNAATLTARMAETGARLLIDTIDGLVAKNIIRQPQDNSLATQAPAIQPQDGYLDWQEPAERLWNRIRGVTPKPGAFAVVRDRRIKIWRAQPAMDEEHVQPVTRISGTLIALPKSPRCVLVAAGEGTTLSLLEVQPESGKRMMASDWARGLHLSPGEQMTSPY